METFPVVISNPKALIIHCDNPDFSQAFYEFPTKVLNLSQGEFIPIAVPGGPAAFAHQTTLKEESRVLTRQIEFAMHHYRTIRKIVVIVHQDCCYYINHDPDMACSVKDDLLLIAATLRDTIKVVGAKIECYFAGFTSPDHTGIYFEIVPKQEPEPKPTQKP